MYNPSVFQSLMQSSESMVSWSESTGAIMSLEFMPNEVNKFITVSNYGEIVFCERKGVRPDTKSLFKNSQYDFRDLYIDKSTMTVYAISRTGQLVIIALEPNAKSLEQKIKIVDIDNMEHPAKVNYINNDNLLIIGENRLSGM